MGGEVWDDVLVAVLLLLLLELRTALARHGVGPRRKTDGDG